MNNYIKILHKTEKECNRKHNTDYSCLESLLNFCMLDFGNILEIQDIRKVIFVKY